MFSPGYRALRSLLCPQVSNTLFPMFSPGYRALRSLLCPQVSRKLKEVDLHITFLRPVVKMGTTIGTRLSAPHSRRGGRSHGSCGSESGCHLPMGTLLLVAVGQGVEVLVVNQGMIAITPGECLAPDPEVVIGDKLRGGMGALISHAKGVDVPKDDDGDGSKEEALPPGLVSTSVATAHLPDQARSLGGDAQELLVRPC